MSVWAALKDKFRTDEQCVEISCDDFKGQVPGKIYPPDRAQIGVAAWRYLHAMAANHPEQPTPAEQADAQRWLVSFIQFYPCKHCAAAFVEQTEENPPTFGSRNAYATWWCEAHNRVSEDLGKDEKPCNLKDLIQAGQNGLTIDELPKC